jgi:serine/threonine-protein kinase
MNDVGGGPLLPAEIMAALDRVLASDGFRNSDRLRRFLRLTVEATLDGQASQLKEYALGRDAFDRGPDYDPRTDSIVRVEAQRLRRKLREYYETAGRLDPVRIEVHSGSYVPEFLRAPAAPEPSAETVETVLDPNTVAVLPFANLSPEAEQGYFCDGITEDIINALTTVPELRVLGSASMFRLRDTPADVRDIGEKLGAGTIVEGSVRRSAGVLRISAKLMNAQTRLAMWSSSFDRPLGDVFAVKDEIAGAIAGTLRVTLGFDPKPPLRDGAPSIEAYTLYLKGRQATNRLDLPGYKSAIELFGRAISLFPDYALPYAALADLYASSALISVMRPFEVMPRAKRAAMEALRLDPRLAQAFAALGWVTFFFDRQWEQGLALTRRAVTIAPSYAFGHFTQGACHTILGQFDDALACFERALQLDPLSLRVLRALAWTLSAAGRFEEAERRARVAVDLSPDSSEPYYMMALIYLQSRKIADALGAIQKGHRGSPTPLARGLEAAIFAAAGDHVAAQAILEQLRASGDWVDPVIYSRVYLELGDKEKALDHLRQSIEERSPLALYAPTEPLYGRLRSSRAFRDIVAPLKLPAALTAAVTNRP